MVRALILAVSVTKLVELIGHPLADWLGFDRRFLLAAALGLGVGLTWLAGVDLFAEFEVQLGPVVGRVLTGLFVGGGGSVVYDLLDGWTSIAQGEYGNGGS